MTGSASDLQAPLRKPDGSQIAIAIKQTGGSFTLSIIQVSNGLVVNTGPVYGSPFSSWGVDFPRGMTSFGRCE